MMTEMPHRRQQLATDLISRDGIGVSKVQIQRFLVAFGFHGLSLRVTGITVCH